MSSSQATANSAKTAEENAGFYYVFQIFVHFFVFYSRQGLYGMTEEQVIAKLGHRQRGMGAVATGHGTGTCTPAGTGFEIRSQGIANTGNEVALGSLGNNTCIDEDDVRIAEHVDNLNDNTFLVVYDRKACTRSVVRSNRRQNNARNTTHESSYCFCRINGSTTASADNDVTTCFCTMCYSRINGFHRALIVEFGIYHFFFYACQCGFYTVSNAALIMFRANEQEFIA